MEGARGRTTSNGIPSMRMRLASFFTFSSTSRVRRDAARDIVDVEADLSSLLNAWAVFVLDGPLADGAIEIRGEGALGALSEFGSALVLLVCQCAC